MGEKTQGGREGGGREGGGKSLGTFLQWENCLYFKNFVMTIIQA